MTPAPVVGWKRVRGAVLRLAILGPEVEGRVTGSGYHSTSVRVTAAYNVGDWAPSLRSTWQSLRSPACVYVMGEETTAVGQGEAGIYYYHTPEEARRH